MKYKKEPKSKINMLSGPPKKRRQSKRQRGKWFHLSRRFRAANPMCQSEWNCKRVATEVHHIIPFDEDPSKELQWSNLMSVCEHCHKKIHKRHIDRDKDIPNI